MISIISYSVLAGSLLLSAYLIGWHQGYKKSHNWWLTRFKKLEKQICNAVGIVVQPYE